jgi:hypothetical protein
MKRTLEAKPIVNDFSCGTPVALGNGTPSELASSEFAGPEKR